MTIRLVRAAGCGASLSARAAGATALAVLLATTAHAAPGQPLINACTGASLQPVQLAPLLTTLTTDIYTPLTALPIVGPGLLANVGGTVTDSTSGAPIGLGVQTIDPTTGVPNGVLTPGSQCNVQSSGFQLATDKGITIGGNSIDGLGSTGLNANAGEVNSIALGNSASTAAAATGAIAIGRGATANTAGGVAIGAGSTDKAATPTAGATIGGTAYTFAGTTPASVVSVGAAGAERQIANVAAGQLSATSTDAVNGSQLFATNTAVNANAAAIATNTAAITTNTANIAGNTMAITNLDNGTAGVVQQSGTPGRLVLVAPGATGAAPGAAQTLGNVAPGSLAAGSTDAVNGGQLATTNAQVAANTGAITTNATNIAGNTTAITNLTNGINGGTIGLVQQTGGSPGTGQITVGAATGGTSINVAGTDGNRTISGVAAGVLPTDAANVGQLTGAIGTATANAVQYDTAGGVRQNSVTLAGGAAGPVTVTNVAPGALTPASTDAVNGSQLAATNAQVAANTGAITTNTMNIAGNTAAITNLTTGAAGTVQRTATANDLALTAPGATGAAPGAAQVLSNVAAGIAPTDAVNLGQVGSLIGASAAAGPVQYSTAAAPTTANPGVVSNDTTLVGTAPGTAVTLHNVAAGAVTPASTDAVNGSQLAATNGQVATNTTNIAGNTTAITNLTNGVNGGTAGLVQQTGGAPGNGQITVGAATGGTSVTIAGTGGTRTLTGLSAGVAGNDAVTVAQINGLTGNGLNNVQYDPAADGGRSNTITLAGEAPGTVRITNVGGGTIAPGSTDAVNGGQLAATNLQVATNTTTITNLTNGTAGAFQSNNAAAAAAPVASGANAAAGGFGATASGAGSVALGNGATATGPGSVALGQGSTDGGQAGVVSVGSVGGERRITNVAPGVNGTDAVNIAQLQAATNAFTTTTTGLQNQITGLQGEINQTNFDLNQVRRRANGGTAGAMAVAGLPQAFEPGRSMVGGAVGYWADQVAFAIGVSSVVGEHTVLKAGGSISNQGIGGFNAGIGFQF